MRRNVSYDPDNDYYTIIGVAPNADSSTIQRAYRAKAKKLHPDVNQDRHEWAKERFQLLNEAYSILNDVESRRIYDNLRWPYQFHSAQGTTHQQNYQSAPPRPQQQTWSYEERPYKQYYQARTQQPFRQATSQQQPQRAAWLDGLKLGWLKPFYIAIVDLIESPYRYILLFLAVLLGINVAFIAVGVLRSNEPENNNVIIVATNTLNARPTSNPNSNTIIIPTFTTVPSVTPPFVVVPTSTPQPSPTPTLTLEPSEMACHPGISIISPQNAQPIFRHSLPEEVQIVGQIMVDGMFTYSVEARPIDISSTTSGVIELRERQSDQEQPIENNILATLDDLRYEESGTYEIVIIVWDNQQIMLGQCSIVVAKIE